MTISPEAFRNELYASTATGPLSELTFSGLVSHRAELKGSKTESGDNTAGSDAALAALQNSLASYEQDRQAKQSTIVSSVLPAKGRGTAGKQRPLIAGQQSSRASPHAAATSNPSSALLNASNSDAAVKQAALRKPVIHLLALRSASIESIMSKTHIPKEDLDPILQKIAKHEGGKWQLSDKAFRDLDVWSFGYGSTEERQKAVDNAIRSYDRQRIGKEEKIWQQLLPEEDRGKGIILSRLNGGGGGQVNRGLAPNYAPSPLLDVEKAGESKPGSIANTPKLGASTPRPASSKGDVMKRLLSKDPKKARAMDEAREKKRKEREARETTASDREGARPVKRQTTTKENPKVKSAEIVHSSEDESGEEGEVKEEEITRVDSKVSPQQPKAAGNVKTSSPGGNVPNKVKDAKAKTVGKPKAALDPAKSIASLASKSSTPLGAGKSTPRSTTGLTAPTSQHKSQRSPQKADSRPNVPSPLGAARPRVASDVSDRSAIGVQRTKQATATGTPHGLGITTGSRKRHDTVTSNDSGSSSGSDKKLAELKSSAKPSKPAPSSNGTTRPKPTQTNGAVPQKPQNGVKRKAGDSAAPAGDEDEHAAKHRKTDSASSQSQKSHASSTAQTTARTSPNHVENGGGGSSSSNSSDSAASVLDSITFTQGVNLAEKFRDTYYPAYTKMYDAQAAKEASGVAVGKEERERLWAMHRRLEQMKMEIRRASLRAD